MTDYIFDADNPAAPVHGDYETAVTLNDADRVWLAEGSDIAAYGYGGIAIFGGYSTYLSIKGRVYSDWDMGILTSGAVSVGATGKVIANKYAIQFYYNSSSPEISHIKNDGEIRSESQAVLFNGSGDIRNNGTITAEDIAIVGSRDYIAPSESESFLIVNNGLISAKTAAIWGMRQARNWVENYNTIKGDIVLGDKRDYYFGATGTVSGVIYLYGGDDIAEGGTAAETMFGGSGTNILSGNGGIDTLIFAHDAYRSDLVVTVDLQIKGDQQTTIDSRDVIDGFENVIGNSKGDFIYGDSVGNGFKGKGGNDLLDGRGGDDMLEGGAGDDNLLGGSGKDTAVFSGKYSDYVITANHDDTFTIADKRSSGDGTDTLTAIEFAFFSDRVYTLPNKPSETPTTDAPPASPVVKNLTFKGGKKADTFVGGKGHDLLNGGLGNDKLTGDEGQDTFVFNTKLGSKNVDRILDFKYGDDSIKLSKAIFSKIEKGMLSKGAFWVGAKAHDKSDRIIFNDKTGALFYDADGSGKKYGAVKFAQLAPETLLKHDDFFIA